MKLQVIGRGAVSALLIGGVVTGMAGAAAAGPIEDAYREVQQVPGKVADAVDDACTAANCAGIQGEIDEVEQGLDEDIQFLQEEFVWPIRDNVLIPVACALGLRPNC